MKCVRAQRAGVRRVGLALALLTAASPLLDSLHEASVRHVACPEDGELVEAPVQRAHSHRRDYGVTSSLFAENDSDGPRGVVAGHDHCAIALQGHLRAREQSQDTGAIDALALTTASFAPAEPRELHGFTLYLLVPKASPPA